MGEVKLQLNNSLKATGNTLWAIENSITGASVALKN